jgi:predicted nuclease of restriction endonuclease-like RecB superfamily
VCIPDLVFEHGTTGECVYLEVMGYWSRDAVWRRVELVQAGLDERVLFAVGQHLRVSEAALDDELPGALYVYKRTMVAKTIVERVEALASTRRIAPKAPTRRGGKARVPAEPAGRPDASIRSTTRKKKT